MTQKEMRHTGFVKIGMAVLIQTAIGSVINVKTLLGKSGWQKGKNNGR